MQGFDSSKSTADGWGYPLNFCGGYGGCSERSKREVENDGWRIMIRRYDIHDCRCEIQREGGVETTRWDNGG